LHARRFVEFGKIRPDYEAANLTFFLCRHWTSYVGAEQIDRQVADYLSLGVTGH
jgi:hypothetical protein